MKKDRYRALAFVAALAAVCLLVLCFVAPPVHAEPNHPQEVALVADVGAPAMGMALQPIPAVLLNQHDPQPPPSRYCLTTANQKLAIDDGRGRNNAPPVYVDWPAS